MAVQQTLFILSVQNIADARRFYRDVVGLGTPKLDSNFWVEFALSNECSFCLEQNNAPTSVSRGKITCLFHVTDILEFRQRYESAGFHTDAPKVQPLFGENASPFLDSEGNILYITDEKYS